MAATVGPPIPASGTVEPATAPVPAAKVSGGHERLDHFFAAEDNLLEPTQASRRVAVIGLLGLRLALGFEFLWAFLDKTFGWGWSTAHKDAWIRGGSPTNGFLAHVSVGPLQGFFHDIAGSAISDWLFMLGLLGVGVGLIFGVAIRPAAIAGCAMYVLMYLATWPYAKMGGGQPTASPNPIVDEHLTGIVALIAIGALAAWSFGPLSRRWAELPLVKSHSWLR